MKKLLVGSILAIASLSIGCYHYVDTGMIRRCVSPGGLVEPEYYCMQTAMYPGYGWYYGGPTTFISYGTHIYGGSYVLPEGRTYYSRDSSSPSAFARSPIVSSSPVGGSTRGVFGSTATSTYGSSTTAAPRSFGSSFTAGSGSAGMSARGGFGGSSASFGGGGFGG